MNRPRILIINDDKLVRRSLYEMLCGHGYGVEMPESARDALSYLDKNRCQVVLADLNGKSGTELLKKLKQKSHPAEVIILTSYGNVESAVDCIKIGAFDYLVRPVEDEKIIYTIERAFARMSASQAASEPIKKLISTKEDSYHGLVGTTGRMKEIYSLIDRIAGAKATVLLRGESGTGKRMVAHAIHQADRRRRNKPFVEISCGALPRDVIESELFGHTKGAFTGAINDRKGRFELANGGTLLLDDIDSFSLELQVKLLRVLQEKEFERVGDHKTMKVDVRIIVSTNQDLEKAVSEKRFREDLYYRLNVISINLPPLRERKDDLPLLIDHFVNLYARENHKKVEGVSREVMDVLTSYNWPGNIRELENIVERAVILDTDNIIQKDDLPEIIRNGIAFVKDEPAAKVEITPVSSLKDALEEPEKVYIMQVLKEMRWNKKKAAIKLGVNRTTLYNKLRKYNLLPYIDKKEES